MSAKIKVALIGASAMIIAAFISKSKTQENSSIVTNDRHKTNIDVSGSNIEIGDQSPVIIGDHNIINFNDMNDENNNSGEHYNDIPLESNINTENFSDIDENNIDDEPITPFVTSNPKQDGVTCVNLVGWTENDRDIFGNAYTSNTALKISIYNMINAIGGGSHDIIAEVHIPLGERYSGSWKANFVVAKEMMGNGSFANITILSGEEELVPTFILESTTTDEKIYEIDLEGIRDLIIRFDCHAVGGGFCAGMIFE